jgi:hypothetical protein
MIQSRTKGKRAELEACRALELVFDVKWQRTAQVSGKFSADVMPSQDIGLHVEVKHYASGLTWWTKRGALCFPTWRLGAASPLGG